MKNIMLVSLLVTSFAVNAQLKNSDFQLLKRLVDVNSASDNSVGLEAVRSIIKEDFLKLKGLTFKEYEVGDSEKNIHKVLQLRFPTSDNKINGPGVIDMKGGIVLIRAILEKLSPAELAHVQILLNDDEEIGSIYSENIIRNLIPSGSSVLVLEPGLPDGSVVSSQGGVVWLQLDVIGKAAHAGLEPQNGFSASTEISYKIINIAELSDLQNGLNLNVGVINGGTKANVVCEQSSAKIDMRFRTVDQYNSVLKQVQNIVEIIFLRNIPVNFTPKSTIRQLAFLPPLTMDKTSNILRVLNNVSKNLGITVGNAHVGYGSDGNNIADLPVDILVGLGPYGAGMHTKDEFMDISSFDSRLKLNINLIKQLVNKN